MQHDAAVPTLAARAATALEPDADLRLLLDGGEAHPAWDEFVRAIPAATYLQTSIWARVKQVVGLRATRILLLRGGEPVAGCQVLSRHVAVLGQVGYVPLGPVAATADAKTLRVLVGALEQFARREHIRYLTLQPAAHDPVLAAVLREAGFAPVEVAPAPVWTVQIPLEGRSDEDLLAPMRASTRGNLRRAERSSVRVRCGGERDLPTLQRHLEATAARQGFQAYSADYNERLFSAFDEAAEARLLIAELDGEPLASALIVGFGDTAVHKVGGWSGTPSKVRPNELIHWVAMRWARDSGYGYYDLGGISSAAALAVKEGGEYARSDPRNGVAFFKLGLGGQLVQGSGAYALATPAVLGQAMRIGGRRLQRNRLIAQRLAGRGR